MSVTDRWPEGPTRTYGSTVASMLGTCAECGGDITPGDTIHGLIAGRGWICGACASLPYAASCPSCPHPMEEHSAHGCTGDRMVRASVTADDATGGHPAPCRCGTKGPAAALLLCERCEHELANHDNGGCRDCSYCRLSHAGVLRGLLVRPMPNGAGS